MCCALSPVAASRKIEFRVRSFFAFFGERTQTIHSRREQQVLSNFNKFPRPVCNGDAIWQVAIADSNQKLGYRILAQVYMKDGVGAVKTDEVAEREAHQVWTWLRSMIAHGLTVSEACKCSEACK